MIAGPAIPGGSIMAAGVRTPTRRQLLSAIAMAGGTAALYQAMTT
ncbi:twin-arginine translocation signal domain-containing protein, partial [Caulobacter sp. B11]